MKKLSSKKIEKVERPPRNEKKINANDSTSLVSTAAPSWASVRPSDLSCGGRLSEWSIDDGEVSMQIADGEVKTESVTFEVVEVIDIESASEPLCLEVVVANHLKIEDKVEEVEVVERAEEMVAVVNEKELRCKQGVKLLFASTAAHNFALQLAMPANQSIWLNHFDGDFAAQAANTSNLMSAALAAGVFVNPVIASTSDVVGRKPVVMGGLAISALGKALCAVQPSASALRVQTVLVMPDRKSVV